MKSAAPAPSLAAYLRDAGVGLALALLVVLVLLFAGSEDRGFIYVDF